MTAPPVPSSIAAAVVAASPPSAVGVTRSGRACIAELCPRDALPALLEDARSLPAEAFVDRWTVALTDRIVAEAGSRPRLFAYLYGPGHPIAEAYVQYAVARGQFRPSGIRQAVEVSLRQSLLDRPDPVGLRAAIARCFLRDAGHPDSLFGSPGRVGETQSSVDPDALREYLLWVPGSALLNEGTSAVRLAARVDATHGGRLVSDALDARISGPDLHGGRRG